MPLSPITFQCPNCQKAYDQDNVAPMANGYATDTKQDAKIKMMCQSCGSPMELFVESAYSSMDELFSMVEQKYNNLGYWIPNRDGWHQRMFLPAGDFDPSKENCEAYQCDDNEEYTEEEITDQQKATQDYWNDQPNDNLFYNEALSQRPKYSSDQSDAGNLPEDYDEIEEHDYVNDPPVEVPFSTEAFIPPPLTTETQEGFNLTDAGNAKRLALRHGANIRYSAGSWYKWNDKYWQVTGKNTDLMKLAKDVAASICKEANNELDEKKKKEINKWGLASESEARLKSMISLCKSEDGIEVHPDFFDADERVFNVENGTIDLRWGKLRKHYRADYITKMSPVVFDPDAKCPTWDKFLLDIGSLEISDYLSKIIGYSMSGNTDEDCLFFLFGDGANGKSTFLETIRELLGPYAQQADFNTFLTGNRGVRNDIAGFQGARFISGVEPDAGKKFDESLIKRLTGGDKISARKLYQEATEFNPTFKIFLAANHMPTITGTDHGIRRRIRFIPFTKQIQEDKIDKQLSEKLKGELPGILNWALRGCRNWQSDHRALDTPAEIMRATSDYYKSMDVVGRFIDEECTLDSNQRISTDALYQSYTTWCAGSGEKSLSKNSFGEYLNSKGLKAAKSGSVRYREGINITVPPLTF